MERKMYSEASRRTVAKSIKGSTFNKLMLQQTQIAVLQIREFVTGIMKWVLGDTWEKVIEESERWRLLQQTFEEEESKTRVDLVLALP